MSDAEWAVCEPLLPHPAWLAGKGGRPSAYCMRDVVDGIRYLTHNGPVRRALPADFPPAWTVYYWASKWQADGSTQTMHDQIRDQVRQDSLRPLMFGIAYRMLGSASEAEDVVQDAFLRLQEHPPDEVRNLPAYVTTVTTRLAIDELRSARRRRESYVGTWLPEPVITDLAAQPEQQAEQHDTISLAALVMLERLTPVERAVFVLRTAFSYDYDDIVEIVGKSAANCRQILRRARSRVTQDQPRFAADSARRDELARRFLTAAADGDVAGLEKMLSADVVFYGDGGGKAPALREPVTGRIRVARFVAGITRQALARGLTILPARINGDPGVLAVDAAGVVVGVTAVQASAGRVVAIRNILNPDKLAHLTPLRPPA